MLLVRCIVGGFVRFGKCQAAPNIHHIWNFLWRAQGKSNILQQVAQIILRDSLIRNRYTKFMGSLEFAIYHSRIGPNGDRLVLEKLVLCHVWGGCVFQ